MKRRKPLNPEIKGIDVQRSSRYIKSRATVTFEVSNENEEREELTVEYPVQDNRHLTMLLKDKENKVSLDHEQITELSTAIKGVIPKED